MEGLQSGGDLTGGSASLRFGLSGLQSVWTSPWLVGRRCSRPGTRWGWWPLFGLLIPCHFMGPYLGCFLYIHLLVHPWLACLGCCCDNPCHIPRQIISHTHTLPMLGSHTIVKSAVIAFNVVVVVFCVLLSSPASFSSLFLPTLSNTVWSCHLISIRSTSRKSI